MALELNVTQHRIIMWAQKQIGVCEDTGTNDGVPSTRYMRGKRQVPWCAYFVLWVLEQSGVKVIRTEKEWWEAGAVKNLAKLLDRDGVKRKEGEFPKPGDVCIHNNRSGSDKGPGSHCSIVTRVKEHSKTVRCVDGNWGNCVKETHHKFGDSGIDSYYCVSKK